MDTSVKVLKHLAMDSAYNVTIPVQSVSMPVANIQEGTAFLFYPILLRAVLYIATDGELRVTSPCLSEEMTKRDVTMIKICNRTAAGSRLCFYTSSNGRHFLATNRASGRLVSIRGSAAQYVLRSGNASSFCLPFEEVSAAARGQSTIIGCPLSTKHRLSFNRQRFSRDSSCEISRHQGFSQSASGSTRTRPRNLVISPPEAYVQAVFCRRRSGEVWMKCRKQMQDSYPLHWKSCF